MFGDQPIQRRLPSTDQQKQQMLAVLIRKESAFLAARGRLMGEALFNGDYALAWNTVKAHYDKHQRLPTREELVAEVDHQLSRGDYWHTRKMSKRCLDSLISVIYKLPEEDLKEAVAEKYLRLLVAHWEKLNAGIVKDFKDGKPGSNFSEMLCRNLRQMVGASQDPKRRRS